MGKLDLQAILLMLFLFLFSININSFPMEHDNDQYYSSALLAFKDHLTFLDPNSTIAKNWTQGTSLCTWIGVTCNVQKGVTGLNLFQMGLGGTIPREIGNLSFLTYLNLGNNSFTGQIPNEISNLTSLRLLKIRSNQLSGPIPFTLSLLTNLQVLDLAWNQITGTIPWNQIFNLSSLQFIAFSGNKLSGTLPVENICQHLQKLEDLRLPYNQLSGELTGLSACSELKMLSLFYNNFTGTVPSRIGNLSKLQELYLSYNTLTGIIPLSIGNLSELRAFVMMSNDIRGTIPTELGHLSSLTWLDLGGNKLKGEVPQPIFNLSKLQILSLIMNELSGNLPCSIAKGLPNIKEIYMGSNKFNGRIPSSISNLSRLTRLSFNHNFFSGLIPVTLGNIRQLQLLRLDGNRLSNDLSIPEQEFLTPLTNCKYIKWIEISQNPITGAFPKSFFSRNISRSLERFLAFNCSIHGTIPNEIGNLTSLLFLSIGENNLIGMIPTVWGQLRNLQALEIYNTRVTGPISNTFCNMESLYYANLWGNKLSGKLPMCLANLTSLRRIFLTYNALSGDIQSSLRFNEWIEVISLSGNFFNGSLSEEIGNLKNVRTLFISGNQLSGSIPSTIGQLQSLVELQLQDNMLSGPIPQTFVLIKGLEYLDLSHNNLSGSIPNSLEKIEYLHYFNVSFNDLIGEIPIGGPFQNLSSEFFVGNKGLCGAPRFKLKTCKTSRLKPSKRDVFLKYILPPVALIIIVAAIIILLLKHHRRKTSFSVPSIFRPAWFKGVFPSQRISYHEIMRATNNFDERNLIGRGSTGLVYKGVFPSGITTAIKVFNLDMQFAAKSFDIECQIMRNIRHRNLVKVITSCSNHDFKALVMEYMPNGNLDEWLYSSGSRLNVFQRLEIMIDVAMALDYLHHGCSSPIVHCDLKPSNIFLDEDMVAHVADFSISKLLMKNQDREQTRTLGTLGYMAPEYGSMGFVSTMADVYSYGIVMIEIFTRRKPTHEMFTEELTMRRWLSESFSTELMEIVDVNLNNVAIKSMRVTYERCLTYVMGVALQCTAEKPEDRLNIQDVVLRLQNMKAELLY